MSAFPKVDVQNVRARGRPDVCFCLGLSVACARGKASGDDAV